MPMDGVALLLIFVGIFGLTCRFGSSSESRGCSPGSLPFSGQIRVTRRLRDPSPPSGPRRQSLDLAPREPDAGQEPRRFLVGNSRWKCTLCDSRYEEKADATEHIRERHRVPDPEQYAQAL